MAGRFTPAPDLDAQVARVFLLPAVLTTEIAIRTEGKAGAPVDTGRLRYEIDSRAAVIVGNEVRGEVYSNAIDPDSGDNYAAWQEFGTRYMAPRSYMRNAAARVAQAQGFRYGASPPPWPSR